MYSLWRFNPKMKPIMENIIWWQTSNFRCFEMSVFRLSSVQFFLKFLILVNCLVHRSPSFRTRCLFECETCSFHVCMCFWTNSDHGEQVFGDKEIVVGVFKCGFRLKPVSSSRFFSKFLSLFLCQSFSWRTSVWMWNVILLHVHVNYSDHSQHLMKNKHI